MQASFAKHSYGHLLTEIKLQIKIAELVNFLDNSFTPNKPP